MVLPKHWRRRPEPVKSTRNRLHTLNGIAEVARITPVTFRVGQFYVQNGSEDRAGNKRILTVCPCARADGRISLTTSFLSTGIVHGFRKSGAR